MSNYQQRRHEHDKIAIPYLQDRLKEFGLSTVQHGVEIHDPKLKEFLRNSGRSNPNVLRDRYKPDLYIIPDDQQLKISPVLCEVKSENKGHSNFSIEFDSYCSGKLWDNNQRGVMYAFIRLIDNHPVEIKCCWLIDIKISYVSIPKRFDFEKTIYELTNLYPNIEFKPVQYTSGSGTAFFVIRGDSSYLRQFDSFISDYLGKDKSQQTQCISQTTPPPKIHLAIYWDNPSFYKVELLRKNKLK